MKRCCYCNLEKSESEFSDEHVIPQAIGGNLSPKNPFKTADVCQRCNNFCGLFIDTGFIKSWFTQASRSQEALRHVDFSQDAIFPLTYMGPVQDLNHDGKVCEFWLGPTGDSIYHFHDPYPEIQDMPVLVGPAPNLREEIDPGFAFIFVVPSNPVWWKPIMMSFAEQFKKSTLFLANGATPKGGLFSDIPDDLRGLHKRLDEMRGEYHRISITMTLGHEVRFLAKLALGFGHLFLADGFSASDDAQTLREMMWARNREKRETIPVRGSGFFGGMDQTVKDVLSWPFGHLFVIYPSGDHVSLIASFYNNQAATVVISSNPEHWKNIIPDCGVAYAVSPGLRRFVGPIELPEFVAHRIGNNQVESLVQLENAAKTTSPLPPSHLID